MSHYYSKDQDSELRLKKIEVNLRSQCFQLFFASGVFSKGGVDQGSALLTNTAQIPGDGRVLDLGCGNGVIGVAIAKAHPKTKVVLSDVNERAVKTADMNVKMNQQRNCTVVQSDGFENLKGVFDVILLNPPQTAGKDVCIKLIEQSKAHLAKGGSLQIVARHNKGGKSLYNIMTELFGNGTVLSKSGGFRVYSCHNA